MNKTSSIASLAKKIYRQYSLKLLETLKNRGFTDLRASFLEVLLYIAENNGTPIKNIGEACGLKKQTMTSHINELESRGYIERRLNQSDKREQCIFLTEQGEKFKLGLFESAEEMEVIYIKMIGELELDRVELSLKNFLLKLGQE